jgi:toxin ParE1/3/4
MKRAIRPREAVDHQLAEHYEYIAQDKVEPAERFLVVAAESFERLAQWPEIGLPWKSNRPTHRGLRYYPMPAPYRSYLIFYRSTEQTLDVIAVLHAARDLQDAISELLG